MIPLNVHVNRSPVKGKVEYYKYHPGKFLVAWHPKSSTDNERTSICFETENGVKILMRQIAGAVARRIAFYPKVGDAVEQGSSVGFIRFGSRVDLFLPLDAEIKVKIGDLVKGGETEVAELVKK
jgi:phosphatidylserine decarboxylase